MSAIVTKNQAMMRISSRHIQEINLAIDKINKYINDAWDFPVRIPVSIFSEIDAVKFELVRKLKEEASWVVTFETKDGAYLGALCNEVETVLLNYKVGP